MNLLTCNFWLGPPILVFYTIFEICMPTISMFHFRKKGGFILEHLWTASKNDQCLKTIKNGASTSARKYSLRFSSFVIGAYIDLFVFVIVIAIVYVLLCVMVLLFWIFILKTGSEVLSCCCSNFLSCPRVQKSLCTIFFGTPCIFLFGIYTNTSYYLNINSDDHRI